MNLQIQCPKCSKKFTVHEDLTGKTVECGACDHRFPVKKEGILVDRLKVYPGEQKRRNDEFLSRIGRDPSAQPNSQLAPQPAMAPAPQVDAIMPASAGQNIAAALGVCLLLIYSFLFLMGTSEGGSFRDVDMIKRFVMGGFVSLLGAGLILFGAKNWRAKGLMVIVVLVAGLFGLILIRPVILTPKTSEGMLDQPPQSKVGASQSPRVMADQSALKKKVGYHAMDRKLKSLQDEFGENASDYLVGIFVEKLSSSQFHNLEEYIKVELPIPPDEGLSRYPRNGERSSLIVISGFRLDLDEVVKICDPRLGRATVYPELRLIELKLSALHGAKPAPDLQLKLSNPQDPAFFISNLNELRALDPLRIRAAVSQLAVIPEEVELRYQEEIVAELVGRVSRETELKALPDLGRALLRWANDNPAAIAIVSSRVEKQIEEKKEIPVSLIEFLIASGAEKAPLFVDMLWMKAPEKWSSLYIQVGISAEKKMISHLNGPSVRLKKAAALVLSSIGSERAIPDLLKYKESPDDELKILIERAISAIENR